MVYWLKQLRLSTGAIKGAVLLSPRSKTLISATSLHDEFKRYVSIAGLNAEEISLHGRRHTFGTFLNRKGFDIREIQEAMGYEEIGSAPGYPQVGRELKDKINRSFSEKKRESYV